MWERLEGRKIRHRRASSARTAARRGITVPEPAAAAQAQGSEVEVGAAGAAQDHAGPLTAAVPNGPWWLAPDQGGHHDPFGIKGLVRP
jgi:hypothetical protein